MNKGSLIYEIPGASWSLEFPAEVLGFLGSYAQVGLKTKEAVGQFYARDLTTSSVIVDVVTCLKPKSSWFAGLKIDISTVNRERAEMFAQGLHCLGFWHSHPEAVPQPSFTDRALAASHAKAAKEEFSALLFVIFGTDPFPRGLGVWFHDGTEFLRAYYVP